MGKTLVSGLLLALLLPAWVHGQTDTTAEDQKTLKTLGLSTDGPALLEYFRKRTFKEADPQDLAKYIKLLGDDDYATRENAHQKLLILGAGALVAVKQAEASPDAEVRSRAVELRQKIEAKAEPVVQAATARLIAKAKPAGAAEVLLGYLPFAADQNIIEEISRSLAAVAVVNGKTEEAVVKALTDPLPLKRAAAGAALVRVNIKDPPAAARKLLQDADPLVRLRVGLALVENKDKATLPILVDLLAELGPEHLWPVEDMLVRLAGTDSPSVSLGSDEATRKKCRDAWKEWLAKNNDKIDLAKLDQVQALLGYTLIVQQNINRIVAGKRIPAVGEVVELDTQKKPRWKFDVPTYPVDAHIVRQDRVLVAEYQGGRVTERDFTGAVKWEQAVGGNPIGVQGLPNDNVFVVMQNRLVEYDRSHKEAFTLQRPNHDIFRARKLRNGEVVFITNAGMLTRVEAKTQRIIKSFHVGNIPVLFGSIDILNDGGVLVPDFQQNRVVEYDAEGKQRATFQVQWPNSVQRLPNGNTLVASQNTRRVIEFDRNGREVPGSAFNTDGMVFNARKR